MAGIQKRGGRTEEVVGIGYLRSVAVYFVLAVARIDDGHFCRRRKVVVSTPVAGQVGKSLPHWLQAPTTEVVAEKARNVQPKSCAVSRNLGRQIRFSALGTS